MVGIMTMSSRAIVKRRPSAVSRTEQGSCRLSGLAPSPTRVSIADKNRCPQSAPAAPSRLVRQQRAIVHDINQEADL